jgi:hypothetical protein
MKSLITLFGATGLAEKCSIYLHRRKLHRR